MIVAFPRMDPGLPRRSQMVEDLFRHAQKVLAVDHGKTSAHLTTRFIRMRKLDHVGSHEEVPMLLSHTLLGDPRSMGCGIDTQNG